MSSGANNGGGEGLSLQTLLIAACASAAAAVIVSHLWKDGTVVAAAMTPVIIAIVKELLQKPMESELVKRPVSKIASGSRAVISTSVPVGTRSREAQRGHGDPLLPDQPPPTEPRGIRRDPGVSADPAMTPIRTYGGSPKRRRPVHLKIALVTGLVAFLIAAAALTLPELIFGGAVSSHHSTTLFGGGSGKSSGKNSGKEGDKGQSTQPDQQQGGQQTTPATPAPAPDEPTQTTTTPPSTTPQQSPPQTTPQQTSPVPTTPSPPVP